MPGSWRMTASGRIRLSCTEPHPVGQKVRGRPKRGIASPQKEIELIRARLRWAERLYAGKAKEG